MRARCLPPSKFSVKKLAVIEIASLSVFFGGGTPSMLSVKQIEALMQAVRDNFQVSSDCEITIECNPDDLSVEYLKELYSIGINRVSIGIQSLDDKTLEFLNRRHDSAQAERSVRFARDAGFENVSIDLMFGIPFVNILNYYETLSKALSLKVNHISCYQMTLEPGTILYKKLADGFFDEVGEEEILKQFDYTIETLEQNGYKHYEISNYAKEGKESKHNWVYWSGGKYLGIGPSAHSYDGESRQWNISNIIKYLEGINVGKGYFEVENLTEADKYNEYILTALRTCEGISGGHIRENFKMKLFEHFEKVLDNVVSEGYMKKTMEGGWALERKGIFILDSIVKKFYCT